MDTRGTTFTLKIKAQRRCARSSVYCYCTNTAHEWKWEFFRVYLYGSLCTLQNMNMLMKMIVMEWPPRSNIEYPSMKVFFLSFHRCVLLHVHHPRVHHPRKGN